MGHLRDHLRVRVSTVMVVVALVAGACTSDDGTIPKVGPPSTPGAWAAAVPELRPVADLDPAPTDEVHVAYAPEVPPPITRTTQRIFDVHLEITEGMCPLDPANGVDTEMWGYRVDGDDDVICGSPGPVLRGRVGDVARITLTNPATSAHPHNIDFHAVTGQGGGAKDLTVAPGESATISVRLLYPGAFMYHCAFGDVPVHIARGMVGMFIVDPATPLPAVDHEWAVMQSEWYVGEPVEGVAPFDPDALFAEQPRHVTFNGRTDALTGDNALTMAVGERARIYMVNEGLNLDSNFHPIGSHWDVVYPEGATHPDNRVIRGSQSTLVVAGGGTVVEVVGLVPSTIILVDHALVRTFYKGAIGQIVVTGDADPELFDVTSAAAPTGSGGVVTTTTTAPATTTTTAVAPGDTAEVSIADGAWNPDADDTYVPAATRVAVGGTVTWTNDDALGHTVTSGSSTGSSGTPDGTFDSGNIDGGGTYSVTFDEAGTYAYYCIPHPWMRGSVEVVG